MKNTQSDELMENLKYLVKSPVRNIHKRKFVFGSRQKQRKLCYEQSAAVGGSPHLQEQQQHLRPTAAGAGGGMLAPQPLSHHRKLVELLDAQSTFAYLMQNGALSDQDVDEIQALCAESRAKGNLRLLRRLEEQGRRAQNLLVNVLRQTSQHHLANLLDEGIRIKKFTGSGYLSKKRRRGQVGIEIEVRAIKVPQDSVSNFLKQPPEQANSTNPTASQITLGSLATDSNENEPVSPGKQWVSMEEVRMRITTLSATIAEAQAQAQQASQTQLSSIQQFQLLETTQDDDLKSSRCCLCACFGSIFSSSSKKKKSAYKSTSSKLITPPPLSTGPESTKNIGKDRSDSYKHGDANGNGVHLSPSENGQKGFDGGSSPKHYISSHTTHITSSSSPKLDNLSSTESQLSVQPHSKSMENLQSLLDMLQEKADILYNALQDSNSETRVKLLKYLEQTRGVLVLETNVDDEFGIVSICTKVQQFADLKRDFMSGKLTQDLEECIVTNEVLTKMGVQGLKIKVLINEEDLELAEQDFE